MRGTAVEMLRCPTCLSLLVEPDPVRCPMCNKKLRRRKRQPIVLRDETKITSQAPLHIDLVLAERSDAIAAQHHANDQQPVEARVGAEPMVVSPPWVSPPEYAPPVRTEAPVAPPAPVPTPPVATPPPVAPVVSPPPPPPTFAPPPPPVAPPAPPAAAPPVAAAPPPPPAPVPAPPIERTAMFEPSQFDPEMRELLDGLYRKARSDHADDERNG